MCLDIFKGSAHLDLAIFVRPLALLGNFADLVLEQLLLSTPLNRSSSNHLPKASAGKNRNLKNHCEGLPNKLATCA